MQRIAKHGHIIRILGGMGFPNFQAKTAGVKGRFAQCCGHKVGKGVIHHAGHGQVEATVLESRFQQRLVTEPIQGLPDYLTIQAFGQVKTFGDGQEVVGLEGRLIICGRRNPAEDFNMVALGGAGHRSHGLVFENQRVIVQRFAYLLDPFAGG